MNINFTEVLKKVSEYAKTIGVEVKQKDFDTFFKGDMDGQTIWTQDLDDEEKVFDCLHMIGHCVQWGVSEELYKYWIDNIYKPE